MSCDIICTTHKIIRRFKIVWRAILNWFSYLVIKTVYLYFFRNTNIYFILLKVDLAKSEKLGKLLKKARIDAQLSTYAVSQLTKINIADINALENGNKMRINPFHLKALSSIYKINVLKLYEIVDYIDKNDVLTYEKNNVIIDKINEEFEFQRSKYIPIPVYESVSAGHGAFPENDPITFITVPINQSKNLRAAYIKGDSMEPTFGDGSIVIFDPSIKELKNKEIGIFKVGDEVYLKRFYEQDGQVILTSDNIFYEPIFINKYIHFQICGKYIANLSF